MDKNRIIPLDYHEDLQNVYLRLGSLPGFVILQSSDKSLGRYDILSAFPYSRVEINQCTSNKAEQLSNLKHHLQIKDTTCDLPFQGGAIGYVAYDLGTALSGISTNPQESLKDIPLLDMGLYDWAIIVDHHLKKVTLFAAGEHESTPEIVGEIIELWQTAFESATDFILFNGFKPLISQESYKKSFAKIKKELERGRAYQVNYTQPFHAEYQGDSWRMYQSVIQHNPVPFSAYMKTEHADILSFSPERFLLLDQGHLLASPIKGTVGRSEHWAQDKLLKEQLLSCPKNRAENVMIVDLWRNDLGKIAVPGTVRVPELCAVQSFNSVHHLVSNITAVCRSNIHPVDVFFSCFPGGSITGAPKLEAMKIINEQEVFGRGIYCGSIGYFSKHGRFDSNIAIRTVTAKNNILHLAAGGGIIIDSDCEDEYLECYTKIAAIINGLQ